jgi:hypothetical protein
MREFSSAFDIHWVSLLRWDKIEVSHLHSGRRWQGQELLKQAMDVFIWLIAS